MLDNKPVNYISPEILTPFIIDVLGIHIRSLACCITASFTSIYCYQILCMSFIIHVISFYSLTSYITDVKKSTDIIIYEESNKVSQGYITYTNIVTSIPVLFDICVVGYHSTNTMATINLSIVTGVIGFILKINPLYEWNHVMFHLLLIVQSYYVSLCNLRT